jgi:hypothetical protein
MQLHQKQTLISFENAHTLELGLAAGGNPDATGDIGLP